MQDGKDVSFRMSTFAPSLSIWYFILLGYGAKPQFGSRTVGSCVCVSLPARANVAQCASLAKCRPDARALVCVSRYPTPRQFEISDVTHTMADLDQTHGPIAPAVLPSDTHTQRV